MTVTRSWAAMAALAITMGPLAAHAEGSAPVNAADRHFMDEAASGGMVEIVLGRVAQEKGTNEQVKQFGAHMVDDHNKANEELKAIAAAKGVRIPTGLTAEEKAMASRMKKLKSGFDKQYMAQMLADHRKTVALFDKASTSSADPDVKAFAAKILPTVRSHLDMAQQTSAALSGAPSVKPAKRE